MTSNYVLANGAEADLREIIRYTRKQWSDVQIRRYITKLEHGFERLASGQASFRDISALYPGLRMAHCEHHYVFCLLRDNEPALIVGIFHERMDLMTRLGNRLDVTNM
ncbi:MULTISPECIES: type II toxin-antitoxin system RelE/ParE family toxin [Rhizobium/Agrobacterium group]|uniref:type II toxin-antitoxin system RelE/ParE family toxin n=1 Tax=Rhizobium/Agrobacterium group TaxID=227290 RepID=UPI000B401A44|nr:MULTISPECIES: type II toxin-antitoxin system RelE/ParE family toxin [Rhizobium/Agrobacterium group]MCF1485571.1 type II toxin-antitoxin system RelE/ParE family toxin [Allorhizobium ampelinum]NSZ46261.1 type II toxin-antitoxin system RelE/ParE family toxin [Agrobacterium vitis]NTA25357.1 type II toxin-antitoxin system RelE/ParE family toxin [Allorhizobium ampelinum]OVE97148.1 plasmid stabilization protein ParE [Allorhizobium ampelinum]